MQGEMIKIDFRIENWTFTFSYEPSLHLSILFASTQLHKWKCYVLSDVFHKLSNK